MLRNTKKILSIVLVFTLMLTMSGMGSFGSIGIKNVKAADEPVFNEAACNLLYSADTMEVAASSSKSFGVEIPAEKEYVISFNVKAEDTGSQVYFDYRGSTGRLLITHTQCGILGIDGGDKWPQGNVGLGTGTKVTIRSSGEAVTIWINGNILVENAKLATTGEKGKPSVSWASKDTTLTDVKIWTESDQPVYNPETCDLKYQLDEQEVAKESEFIFETGLDASVSYYTTMTVKSDSMANVMFRSGVYLNIQKSGYDSVGIEGISWTSLTTGIQNGAKITAYVTPENITVWLNGDKIINNLPLKSTGAAVKPGVSWTFSTATTITNAKVWTKGDQPVYNPEICDLKYQLDEQEVAKESEFYFETGLGASASYYTTMTVKSDYMANVIFRSSGSNLVYLNVQKNGYEAVGMDGLGWVNQATGIQDGAKITAYVTPENITVWLNGEKIIDNVSLKYEGTAVKLGVSWTFSSMATITNAKVWTEKNDSVVFIDDEETEIIDGKITLGDAVYGYFCDGKMYAPNTTVEVESGMRFTSVNELSVTMANGAGIRYIGTAGIRFQASITSDNMDAVASDAITEGTLITANDIYQNFDEELTLTYSHAKIDVKNSGWFNGQTGTYCGSVCDVVESNYIREFTARAYVTVNYENADAVTIYSNMGPVRTISQIAAKVKYETNYAGIAEEYRSTIDSFIK